MKRTNLCSRRDEFLLAFLMASLCAGGAARLHAEIGQEVALPRHLQDGEEFQISLAQLLEHGRKVFTAVWTIQEGGGRPLTKGTGASLTDRNSPLLFPLNFNRVSAPDANSCAG